MSGPAHIAADREAKAEIFRHLRLWLETGSEFHRAAAVTKADRLGDPAVRVEVVRSARSQGGDQSSKEVVLRP